MNSRCKDQGDHGHCHSKAQAAAKPFHLAEGTWESLLMSTVSAAQLGALGRDGRHDAAAHPRGWDKPEDLHTTIANECASKLHLLLTFWFKSPAGKGFTGLTRREGWRCP